MSKAFWQGFREGYLKNFWVGFAIAGAFVLGVKLGHNYHPYEECKRMYETPEDISECVWIKENP